MKASVKESIIIHLKDMIESFEDDLANLYPGSKRNIRDFKEALKEVEKLKVTK